MGKKILIVALKKKNRSKSGVNSSAVSQGEHLYC